MIVEFVSVVGQKMKMGGRDGQVRGRRQWREGERGLLGKKEFKTALLLKTALPNSTHQIRSDQISRSVVSDSLWPHESQHTRPPCPSPTPGFTQTHVHRVSDAIQPSHPLSSPPPPAHNPSQHQGLFQ